MQWERTTPVPCAAGAPHREQRCTRVIAGLTADEPPPPKVVICAFGGVIAFGGRGNGAALFGRAHTALT